MDWMFPALSCLGPPKKHEGMHMKSNTVNEGCMTGDLTGDRRNHSR